MKSYCSVTIEAHGSYDTPQTKTVDDVVVPFYLPSDASCHILPISGWNESPYVNWVEGALPGGATAVNASSAATSFDDLNEQFKLSDSVTVGGWYVVTETGEWITWTEVETGDPVDTVATKDKLPTSNVENNAIYGVTEGNKLFKATVETEKSTYYQATRF